MFCEPVFCVWDLASCVYSSVLREIFNCYHNRTEAPLGLTSGLAQTGAGHLNTLHTTIAKVDYFTDIRWSN